MVFGAILEKGEKQFTIMRPLFEAIKNVQKNYNWLISECECYSRYDYIEKRLKAQEYCFISGEELTELVKADDFQWVWGMLSGFEKSVPKEQILKYDLPWADGNAEFWKNPLTIQHPFADIEIVAFDSSSTMIFSRDKSIVDNYRKAFPLSEDMFKYNSKLPQNY